MIKSFELKKYVKSNNIYLKELVELLDCDAGYIYMTNDEKQGLILNDCYMGIQSDEQIEEIDRYIQFDYQRLEDIMRLISEEKRIFIISSCDEDNYYKGIKYEHVNETMRLEIFIPIFEDYDRPTHVIGFLYIGSHDLNDEIASGRCFTKEALKITKRINNTLSKEYIDKKIKAAMTDLVIMLSEIMEMREPSMVNHSYNVAYWSVKIGKKLLLNDFELEKLQYASMLHNIGRMYVSTDILNKKEKLTDEEFNALKKSIVYSYKMSRMLNKFVDLGDIPDIIKYHMERTDGKGYPYGIMGDSIPFLSKILGIADTISTMLSNEYYKKSKTFEEVIDELLSNREKKFDSQIVKAAVEIIIDIKKEYSDIFMGIGTYALLSIKTAKDGESTNINIHGNIRKENNEYVFKPSYNNKVDLLSDALIDSSAVFIHRENLMMEYKVKIQNVENDKIIISKLEEVPQDNVFNIKWYMDGIVITSNKNKYKISLNVIGGDYLQFYVPVEDIQEDFTMGVIKLSFDNNETIIIPGKVVDKYSMGNNMFYKFKYVGIPMTVRDKIYKELFKKQIKIRNMYWK